MPQPEDSFVMEAVDQFLHDVEFFAKGPRAVARLFKALLPKPLPSESQALRPRLKPRVKFGLLHNLIYDSIVAKLLKNGEEHVRCGAWDLIESQQRLHEPFKDCLTALAEMHKEVSSARDALFVSMAVPKRRRQPDVFMDAWRFKREAEYFHKAVKEQTSICIDLGTREPHITGAPVAHYRAAQVSRSSLTVPLLNVETPSLVLQEMRPDVLSDCDDSLDLHTAPNSDSDPRSSRQEHFYSHGYDSPNNTSVILPYQDVTSNHQYPKEPYHLTPCHSLESVRESEEQTVTTTVSVDPFGSSAELASEVADEESPDSVADDEAQKMEVDPAPDSEDGLDEELLTAEIKICTPSVSSAGYEASPFALHPIQLPTLPAEFSFTDPLEYIDRTLSSHGEDPRQYWEVPFSRLSPPDVLHIANTLAHRGIEAAVDLIQEYSDLVYDWMETQDAVQNQSPESTAVSFTSELVSSSDPVVEDSPRRALAGAVGDVPAPLQPETLSALEIFQDPETPALGLEISAMKYDDMMQDSEAKSEDTDSTLAWPYGPSRSTTLDNPVIGEAPDGHLSDQFAAMMQQLPGRVSALGSKSHTPVECDIVPPCVDSQTPEFIQRRAGQPRLLALLPPKVAPLPFEVD